jgi:acetyl-CoA carboxylase biotin carboxylase subunit
VTPFYDPLIAKLIVSGSNREEVLARSRRALAEFRIEGIRTNLPLHRRSVDDPRFIRGKYDTLFLESL